MDEKPERPRPLRDDVGALLRLAGKRREVPEESARRVRAAVHDRWQAEVGRRTGRRNLWLAIGAAAASLAIVAILLGTSTTPTTDGLAASIEVVTGRAWASLVHGGPPADRRSLEPGASLPLGQEIHTEAASGAALRLGSGHSLRLDASSSVRLVAYREVELVDGAIYVDSNSAPEPIVVSTPFGKVVETGTRYEVRLGRDSLRVRQREGSVSVHAAGEALEVDAGQELEINADGSTERRSVAGFGPAWAWTAQLAPVPDFSGRPVRELIDWVAHERGWRLVFADEDTVHFAGATVLSGSLDRLPAERILDAVMPVSGLAYRIDDGALRISRRRP